MRKKIDPVSIGVVGNYIQQQCEELLEAKKSLLSDIERVLEVYKGKDAINFSIKYTNTVNKINNVYEKFLYCSKYMKNVSDDYRGILLTAKNSFNENLLDDGEFYE